METFSPPHSVSADHPPSGAPYPREIAFPLVFRRVKPERSGPLQQQINRPLFDLTTEFQLKAIGQEGLQHLTLLGIGRRFGGQRVGFAR